MYVILSNHLLVYKTINTFLILDLFFQFHFNDVHLISSKIFDFIIFISIIYLSKNIFKNFYEEGFLKSSYKMSV